MKKIYLEPQIKWLQLFGDKNMMQTTSLDVNDSDDDDEVEEIDDLLSKPNESVWDD